MPYMIDASDMRFIEMDVAIGAPMKPRRKGSGPHTVLECQCTIWYGIRGGRTEEVVQERVDGCDDEDDPCGDREETCGASARKINAAKDRPYPEIGNSAYVSVR